MPLYDCGDPDCAECERVFRQTPKQIRSDAVINNGGRHTPGPWCVEDPMDFELAIVEAGKKPYEWRFIACCAKPEGQAGDEHAPTLPMEQVKANARLIAAAPDLLKELMHLVRWHDQLSRADIARAEAAIAKAVQS